MYYSLEGELTELFDDRAILTLGGIAYELWIPSRHIAYPLGSHVRFYTTFIVREQSHTLYGFETRNEKELFETLIGLSGIGPKTALHILSKLSPHDFQEAILMGNITLLSKTPGIGKKTAEKLLLEMKDKLKHIPFEKSSSLVQDALSVLMNLGYTPLKAKEAIDKAYKEESQDLSRLIAKALQYTSL